MNPYWLESDTGGLVEINSGNSIDIRPDGQENQQVILRVGNAERKLYCGPNALAYTAGLARALAASSCDGLIEYGTRKKRA